MLLGSIGSDDVQEGRGIALQLSALALVDLADIFRPVVENILTEICRQKIRHRNGIPDVCSLDNDTLRMIISLDPKERREMIERAVMRNVSGVIDEELSALVHLWLGKLQSFRIHGVIMLPDLNDAMLPSDESLDYGDMEPFAVLTFGKVVEILNFIGCSVHRDKAIDAAKICISLGA